MAKLLSKRDNKSRENLSGWDKAIFDAEIAIRRLGLAIETYREHKSAGVPWPGAMLESNRNGEEAQIPRP
jgi:hypothetical protein